MNPNFVTSLCENPLGYIFVAVEVVHRTGFCGVSLTFLSFNCPLAVFRKGQKYCLSAVCRLELGGSLALLLLRG